MRRLIWGFAGCWKSHVTAQIAVMILENASSDPEGGEQGVRTRPPPLENHKLLYVSLEVLERPPPPHL